MPQVCVFWTQFKIEEVREWKWEELQQGRLRQGWGGPGSRLMENGRPVPFEQWLPGFTTWVHTWRDTPFKRRQFENPRTRYDILTRMLRLAKGDLLIIPHMPSDAEFTLGLVAGPYTWDDHHFGTPKPQHDPDFGHVIPVDSASLLRCRLDASLEARDLAARFQYYRRAVNLVQKPDYAATAWRLFRGDNLHPL